MKKLPLTALVLITLVLAGMAAFFSIFGLSKLFIGASLFIIIWMSALELCKIVIVTLVNQFGKIMPWLLRWFFIAAIVVLMAITGIGVGGFLYSAYTATSIRTQKNEGQIELLMKKDTLFKQEKSRYQEVINTKNNRIKTLSQINTIQENRIDSMYNRGQYKNATKVEGLTSKTTDVILALNKDIDDANYKIKSIDDSIAKYSFQILDLSNNDVATELGPLKYVAASLGISMDKLVKLLIIFLIFVGDPLAVALVMAINIIIKNRGKKSEEKTKIRIKNFWPFKKKSLIAQPDTIAENEIIELKTTYEPHIEEEVREEPELVEELIVEEPIVEEPIVEEIVKSVVEPIKTIDAVAEIERILNESILETTFNNVGRSPMIDAQGNWHVPTASKDVEKIEDNIEFKTTQFKMPIDGILESIQHKDTIKSVVAEKEIVKEEPIEVAPDKAYLESGQEIFAEEILWEDTLVKPDVKADTTEMKENMNRLSETKNEIVGKLVLEDVHPEKKKPDEDFWGEDNETPDENFWGGIAPAKKKDEDFWNI